MTTRARRTFYVDDLAEIAEEDTIADREVGPTLVAPVDRDTRRVFSPRDGQLRRDPKRFDQTGSSQFTQDHVGKRNVGFSPR